jgi:hypothetical protein
VDPEALIVAAGVLSIVGYAVAMWWAIVAYLWAIHAGADRQLAERWLVLVGALLVASIAAVLTGSDVVRLVLVVASGYLIVRGPIARRSA